MHNHHMTSAETPAIVSDWMSFGMRFWDDFLMETSSHRYSGAISLIDLKVIN